MRLVLLSLMTLVLCQNGWTQQQPTDSNESLVNALKAELPHKATNSDDVVKFTDMLDRHANDSRADVEAAFPLLRQYLQDSNSDIRSNTLFAVYSLALRPNSASELSPILSDVYPHLQEEDKYLKGRALLAIVTLRPAPPEEAVAALVDALGRAEISDDFGNQLAGSLLYLRPRDEGIQNTVLAYMDNPRMDASHRADLIESLGYPQLGEKITQRIINVASNSPPGRLRNAAIAACAKIGPRAVNPIRDQLYLIKANTTETPESRSAAMRALSVVEPGNQQTAILIDTLQKADVSDDFGIQLAGELARSRPNDEGAQNAVLAYLNKPGMDDGHKAALIGEIAFGQLGEIATESIVDLANTSPAGKLRDAAIVACAKIGPRAVIQIKDRLDSILASRAESGESRNTASMALRVIRQQ